MDERERRLQELEAEVARLRGELEALQPCRVEAGLLRALLEQSPDQVYFKDRESRFMLASRAVARSFRVEDPRFLAGKSDFDFFSEAHARQAFEDEQTILRTGQPLVAMEEVETWPDGRNTWVSTTKAPLRDAEGAILGTFGISRSITNHKEAEAALKTSEDQLRMLFDHAVDGILMGSPAGRIINANQVICAMTGRAKEDLVGRSIEEIFAPDSLARVPLRYDLLQAGHRVVSERDLLLPDGRRLPIEMHTKRMPDGTYQAIVRDISERRQAEASYRGLFDSVMEAIYILGRDGRFLAVNRGALEMYGQPLEYFLGRKPEALAAPGLNDLAQVERAIARAFEGEAQRLEFWGLRANGEAFPKELRIYPGSYFGQDVVIALAQDISQRKAAEQALRASESHYRELLDGLHEGFAFTDLEERFVFANPAASAIFGTPEGLQGHHLQEFLAPEVFQEVLRQSASRKQGVIGQYELPILRPDGESRVIALSASPWLNEAGDYQGARGLFQDITERKRTEKALRESETNFRNLLEKLGEGFAIVDGEERWTFANSAAARIFGVEQGGLAGHSFREFVDEEAFQEILRQTEKRRRGESSTYEIRIRRKDGELRHVQLSASPYLGENGEYLGADGLFTDVTERRRAEDALRESRVRYLDLFNHTTDAIFWFRLGPEGSLVTESINPTLESWLGRSTAEVEGASLQATFPRHLAEGLESQCRTCIESGRPLRRENVVGDGPGARTFLTLLVPIRDRQGRVERLVGFAQDITQHKQAEEALRQAQKLESLGVLAGGIAHDFNNLLTAMLGNLNLAQMKLAPESPALPHLENVERTVLKAAELTKQMLAYSGKGRFVVKPHDLNHVVQEMTHLLNVSISKKVAIQYDLAPGLPAIEADAAQIQQVVMNLVTNASEAIGDREGVIRIATRRQDLDGPSLDSAFAGQNLQPGSYAVLEISDTGTGIPPEIRGRIFDPFFSTKQSGRGLGLSAMQGILRGHHAGIRITSAPGKGSTFTLFFPLGGGAPVPGAVPLAARPEERLQGRILLVDDEPEVRAATADMLHTLGLEVVTAGDGLEALARFREEQGRIDLVLMDLTMPRMDGREAFRELRKLQEDLPVILFSGYSEHESLRETLAQGFAGFLQKPFLLSELRRAIQQIGS